MSSEEWTLEDIRRFLLWSVAALLALAALIYLGDWAVWRAKVAHGNGMSTVRVGRFVVASLKGGKEEYYADGIADVPCSQSLFAHAANDSCWRLERNPVVFDR